MEPLSTIADLVTVLTPVLHTVRKAFPWNSKTGTGIVRRSKLTAGKRLPGEVFAAELLSEPVRIEPSSTGAALRVVIDRSKVEHAVITSAGKRELCENIIAPEVAKIIDLDRSIHEFVRNAISGSISMSDALLLPPFPFRWASGGIVSLVSIEGCRHVPMFFRDIRPAGWNIPLGSSERTIDHDGHILSELDHELNFPSTFILREFLEETLVLDRSPSHDQPKMFSFRMPFQPSGAEAHTIHHLQDQHRKLRKQYDHLDIRDDGDCVARPSLLALPMDLTVRTKEGDHHLSNVLVSINCLELGIEVVKVIEYDIPKDVVPYFLDGEILMQNPLEPELVRMPVALFPVDLLRQLFDGEVPLHYQGAAQASLEAPRTLSVSDVRLFTWDIGRRNAIIDGTVKGIGTEPARYRKWRSEYGDFSDGKISRLFTPATVKILNMLFSANIT